MICLYHLLLSVYIVFFRCVIICLSNLFVLSWRKLHISLINNLFYFRYMATRNISNEGRMPDFLLLRSSVYTCFLFVILFSFFLCIDVQVQCIVIVLLQILQFWNLTLLVYKYENLKPTVWLLFVLSLCKPLMVHYVVIDICNKTGIVVGGTAIVCSCVSCLWCIFSCKQFGIIVMWWTEQFIDVILSILYYSV